MIYEHAYIRIGYDILYDESDFDLYFEGYEYDDYDNEIITIESEYDYDVWMETYQPYDVWLKKHQYDPSNNTLIINGKRVDAGKVGSKKERHRLNKFLRENGFDPETETILSDIPDGKGGRKRIDFGVGFLHPNAQSFMVKTAPSDVAPSVVPAVTGTTEGRIVPGKEHSLAMPDPELTDQISETAKKFEDEANAISKKMKKLNIQLSNMAENDPQRVFITNQLVACQKQLNDVQQRYQNWISTIPRDKGSIALSKSSMMKKPAFSNFVLKHEEGHIAKGELDPATYTTNKSGQEKNKRGQDFVDYIKQSGVGDHAPNDVSDAVSMNPHFNGNEMASDEYGIQHSKHSKSGMEVEPTLTNLVSAYDKRNMRVAINELKRRQRECENELKTATDNKRREELIEKIYYLDSLIDQVANAAKSGDTSVSDPNSPVSIEHKARQANAAVVNARRQQQQQATDAKRRELQIGQLQQQIASGQLTPQQVSAAKKKIARIEAYNNGLTTQPMKSQTPIQRRKQEFESLGRQINSGFNDYQNQQQQSATQNNGRQAALRRSMDRAPTQDTSQQQQTLTVDNPGGNPDKQNNPSTK